jgi:hypothetical protein
LTRRLTALLVAAGVGIASSLFAAAPAQAYQTYKIMCGGGKYASTVEQ